ncbi:antiviral reverse transcriptase Drt3b [Sphingobacterium pedocola]|uniref:Reverse transcriptase domain-containing protein n=1 Tax=Sphingobacterium pedocola TaxID=2082722 RepID=A0ABR9TBF9_9SPHI|nr:antiviral reverse transcriptase Drt3b [Sphingobacterium pedocola]MBE8722702.1 hypothetical protein [Sphingobacterium pedocola]
MKYKKTIGYKDARVLLSDILPYEVPPFFSNRKFYDFVVENDIHIDGEKLKFKRNIPTEALNIILILFGFDFKNYTLNPDNPTDSHQFLKISPKQNQTIPFDFKISHKDTDYRKLFVMHPINQLEVVNFYKKYNSTILYYTSRSNFSLRKPHRIASLRYFKNTIKPQKGKAEEFIELNKKEYRSLKTYFSYEKYSNIYRYYESYDFQKAEKKFSHLLKFDISRCFDSIYTHSIVWATINKKASKDNLNQTAKSTFGHHFDELMQKHNYNETNGIIIGPELSRIFAEIILQKVDQNVEKILEKSNLKNGEDFEITRYVDDYFVYTNDAINRDLIIASFKKELQTYNLYFNESKTIEYTKPIITEITIAKEEIKKLLNESAIFLLSDEKAQIKKHYLAKDIITNYKSILKSTNTSYKDLQNYFLASIFRNLRKLFKEISTDQNRLIKLQKDLYNDNSNNELKLKYSELFRELNKRHKSLKKKLVEIIELSFFIYTVLPRVSYAIKLSQILITIINFIKNAEITIGNLKSKGIIIKDSHMIINYDFDNKHDIFKRVFDGILTILQKKVINNFSEIETLYLLPIIKNLGHEYNVGEEILNKHFLIDQQDKSNNYFTITFLLNFIQRRVEFKTTIARLQDKILEVLKWYDRKNSEHTFLLFEVLNNPNFGHSEDNLKDFRLKSLDKVDFFKKETTSLEKNNFIDGIANFKNMYFFDWKNPNFEKELNTKRGHEVY